MKICELSSIIGGMNKNKEKEKSKFIVFGMCTISGFKIHDDSILFSGNQK